VLPRLCETALGVLIPFATTCLCKSGFSTSVNWDEIWKSLQCTGRNACCYQQQRSTFWKTHKQEI